MALLGSDFDPAVPADSAPVGQGAAQIRDVKTRLKAFVAVSFNPGTGALLAGAVPNPVTVPYGSVGTVYTSTGPSTPPVWSAGSGILTGMMFEWGGGTVPAGFIEAAGGTALIASQPALAAVYGTNFGGDGVTTFGIPDRRGRVAVGLGTGDATTPSNWTMGQKKGDEVHTLSVAESPAHTHMPVSVGLGNADGNDNFIDQGVLFNSISSGGAFTTPPASSGGGLSHNNLQPSLAVKIIIKT